MLWMGLTGGIASGKSTVAQIFASLGISVVGADQLAHDAMAPGSVGAAKIRRVFGDAIFRTDGSIDRAKLGALVFGDEARDRRHELEQIVHPDVRKRSEEVRQKFEARGDVLAVYEIPLLFEKSLEDQFDLIVTVAVSPEIQIERLIARSALSLDEARARVASQLSQDRKVHASDFVIWNDGRVEDLRRQVEKIVDDVRRQPHRR